MLQLNYKQNVQTNHNYQCATTRGRTDVGLVKHIFIFCVHFTLAVPSANFLAKMNKFFSKIFCWHGRCCRWLNGARGGSDYSKFFLVPQIFVLAKVCRTDNCQNVLDQESQYSLFQLSGFVPYIRFHLFVLTLAVRTKLFANGNRVAITILRSTICFHISSNSNVPLISSSIFRWYFPIQFLFRSNWIFSNL